MRGIAESDTTERLRKHTSTYLIKRARGKKKKKRYLSAGDSRNLIFSTPTSDM